MGVLSGRRGWLAGVQPGARREAAAAPPPTCAGRYWGGGFVSNPRGDFHFEITAECRRRWPRASSALMKRAGESSARIMPRRSTYMVYLKSGAAILEFLAVTPAPTRRRPEPWRTSASSRACADGVKPHDRSGARWPTRAKATRAPPCDQLLAIRTVLEQRTASRSLPPALQDFVKLRVANARRHARGRSWASVAEPAPVQVGRLPPRPPHRAAGQAPGPRLGRGAAAASRPMPTGYAAARRAAGQQHGKAPEAPAQGHPVFPPFGQRGRNSAAHDLFALLLPCGHGAAKR